MTRPEGQMSELKTWQKRILPRHKCLQNQVMANDTVYPDPPIGYARVLCPKRGCRRPLFIQEQATWIEMPRMTNTTHPMRNEMKQTDRRPNNTWWWEQRCENDGRWGHIANQCDQKQVQLKCTFCGQYLHEVDECPKLYRARQGRKVQVLPPGPELDIDGDNPLVPEWPKIEQQPSSEDEEMSEAQQSEEQASAQSTDESLVFHPPAQVQEDMGPIWNAYLQEQQPSTSQQVPIERTIQRRGQNDPQTHTNNNTVETAPTTRPAAEEHPTTTEQPVQQTADHAEVELPETDDDLRLEEMFSKFDAPSSPRPDTKEQTQVHGKIKISKGVKRANKRRNKQNKAISAMRQQLADMFERLDRIQTEQSDSEESMQSAREDSDSD